MATSTKEDPVASSKKWYKLRNKAAELDKPASTFRIQVDSKGHCLVSGYQDDELQRFDELAGYTTVYKGCADLTGEAARDFLAVLLMDYFLKQTTLRQEVGLVGGDDWAIIASPFRAAKIYFGVLASQAPAQRGNDELLSAPKAATPGTSPTNGPERSDSEIDYDDLTEDRREVMFKFLKRDYLKVESRRDAFGVLSNKAHLHALYERFREAKIIMIPSSAYLGITWFKLKTNKDLQERYDKRIAHCLKKDIRRNWERLWDRSPQVPQVP